LNAKRARPVSSRDLVLPRPVFQPKQEGAEHRVKALDGGDADAADAEQRKKAEGRIKKIGSVDLLAGEFFRAGHVRRKPTEKFFRCGGKE